MLRAAKKIKPAIQPNAIVQQSQKSRDGFMAKYSLNVIPDENHNTAMAM